MRERVPMVFFVVGCEYCSRSVASVVHELFINFTNLIPLGVGQGIALILHPIIHHTPVGVHLHDELRQGLESRFKRHEVSLGDPINIAQIPSPGNPQWTVQQSGTQCTFCGASDAYNTETISTNGSGVTA